MMELLVQDVQVSFCTLWSKFTLPLGAAKYAKKIQKVILRAIQTWIMWHNPPPPPILFLLTTTTKMTQPTTTKNKNILSSYLIVPPDVHIQDGDNVRAADLLHLHHHAQVFHHPVLHSLLWPQHERPAVAGHYPRLHRTHARQHLWKAPQKA